MAGMKDEIDNVIEFFGGRSNLARALDCSPQAVHKWIKKGAIPSTKAIRIELLTGGRFKASILTKATFTEAA